jgi:hypothetical protein
MKKEILRIMRFATLLFTALVSCMLAGCDYYGSRTPDYKNPGYPADVAVAWIPPPPPAYSEESGSAFYEAVNEIYTISQNLSKDDSLTAKFWGYEPLAGEVHTHDDVSHAANIVTQMVALEKLSLQDGIRLHPFGYLWERFRIYRSQL